MVRNRRQSQDASGRKHAPEVAIRMPAEWEPHTATWLAWPHFEGDWPGKFEPIPWVYAESIRNLARHERVELIVENKTAEKKVRTILTRANAMSENVSFHHWRTDRVWTRDSGCTFVEYSQKNGSKRARQLRAIKWRFNAWAKYSNWNYDEKIGSLMAQAAGASEICAKLGENRVVLEGGSIDVNGRGTLLTTEECLLSTTQQRNPNMQRRDYEEVFAKYLGIRTVIWLGGGIVGDDTHGHVDDISRFVAPRTVLTMVEPNRKDANHAPLRENVRRLRAATDQDGKRLNVVELPMPQEVAFEGRRLPASYGNFYIANGVVLVPVFNDPNDRVALNTVSELFPDRDVVPIYSGDLIWGFGAMHCMTQQQPAITHARVSP
jgi:agmatine deiminase